MKRLSKDIIKFIQENKGTMQQSEIARRLKIHPSNVSDIVRGKRNIHNQHNSEYFNLEEFAKYYKF